MSRPKGHLILVLEVIENTPFVQTKKAWFSLSYALPRGRCHLCVQVTISKRLPERVYCHSCSPLCTDSEGTHAC